MMKINLSDNGLHLRFAPLTLTRPVGDLRMGIFTNVERWKQYIPEVEIGFHTEAYLSGRFPSLDDALTVNGAVVPNEDLAVAIFHLENDQALYAGELFLAGNPDAETKVQFLGKELVVLENRWDLYMKNDAVLRQDFERTTNGRKSADLSDSVTVVGPKDQLFLEEGAVVEASVINTKTGPVYIGREAEVMEGSLIRGPFSLGEHAQVKMGAKIYGATTIGPECRVGGEVSNSVFQAFSNKGHDGFLGNALVGEWCNFGADTNTSNLKNNYGMVDTYSYETSAQQKTNVQFMGVCMGDHSKCGINTMFNTGTVVGVSSNIYGAGFPEKWVPSFSWGGPEGIVPFRFEKAIEYANNMMSRRKKSLSEEEIKILKHIFNS
jgi:UDP-N-acetylglucosamine diphosphorylase/glucosamine-1-phosphate N-acetyltransferase